MILNQREAMLSSLDMDAHFFLDMVNVHLTRHLTSIVINWEALTTASFFRLIVLLVFICVLLEAFAVSQPVEAFIAPVEPLIFVFSFMLFGQCLGI